jgi:hypothetical protein
MNSGVTSVNASQPPQPVSVASDLEALYREAMQAETEPGRLREIWEATKSVRVRKAVASNPNCDDNTMRMAARLYVKEVVNNPSFEMLNLFQEEGEVKDLYEAYSNPQTFGKARNLHAVRSHKRFNIARTLLVSPNLSDWRILGEVCAHLNSAEFKREMKDQEVRDNVVKVARKNLKELRLPTLLFLFQNDIIGISDLDEALEETGTSEFMSSRGAYTSFITDRTFAYLSTGSDYSVVFNFLRVHRANNIRDFIKKVKVTPELQNDAHLNLYTRLYRDFLYTEVTFKRKEKQDRKNRYGYSPWVSFGDDDHSHHLSDLIWAVISIRNSIPETKLEDLNLSALYSDIHGIGFHEDYGPYKCELKFPELKFLTGRNVMCQKLLELESDEAFEFFMTCGILWKEWYAEGHQDNPETKVVARINRINEKRFKSGLKPHYDTTILDYPAHIHISDSNGLRHDPQKYNVNVN